METSKFINDFVQQLDNHFLNLYTPALSQLKKYSCIFHYLVNVSQSHQLLLRKVEIVEFVDNEFVIKVNHDIEIHYIIGKEVEHA